SCHPSVLLKLYIYGYLNRVQSSRRLEREACRNVAGMWLAGRLVPDHKTIADFRKDNGPGDTQGVHAVRRRLPKDRPSDEGERRHRRQQVQSGQQSRQEFYAREDGAPACSNRGEGGAVSEPARHRRPAGTNGSPRCEDGAPQGEACQAGDRDAALESDREGDVRSQLAKVASQAKDILGADHLDAVADRGYFNSPEILACEQADITVTLPKPMTSGAKSDGRFGKQDFVYLPTEDVYRCPAGEKLTYRYTNEEDGKTLRRCWTTACSRCPFKSRCTTGPERRITRWEHEYVLEAVQQRLDENPQAMRVRRETVEHPLRRMKMRMGATHFLMKRLPKVATEMALHVLAYNLTRVMNILGVKPFIAAIQT